MLSNSTGHYGGGAYFSLLENCTVVRNTGGGNYAGELDNCIYYYNSPNNSSPAICNYSCTTPLRSGPGNITNEPAFVDWTNGNFRLLPASACIDAGANAYAQIGEIDLDGQPRILGPSVDMGAYEGLGVGAQIGGQPQGLNAMLGSPVLLSAVGTGTKPLAYQWRRDNSVLASATNSDFDLAHCRLGDGGSYCCVVTNAYGAATSQVANLLVLLKGNSCAVQLRETNAFGMNIDWSETNRLYRLQYKNALNESVWQTAGPWLDGNGSNLSVLGTLPTNGQRFYRLESAEK